MLVRHTIIHRFAAVFFSPHFVVMCCFKFIYAVFLRYLSIVFFVSKWWCLCFTSCLRCFELHCCSYLIVECYFSSRFIECLHIERCTRWRFSLRSHSVWVRYDYRRWVPTSTFELISSVAMAQPGVLVTESNRRIVVYSFSVKFFSIAI